MSAFDSHLDNYGDPGAGWANDPYWGTGPGSHLADEPDWQPDEDEEAEAAAFEDQRAFERWADDMILDDENADVSEAAYLTYLEGFFPPD